MKSDGPRRIYIIDEHEPVRKALAERLRRSPAVEVIGESGAATEAAEEARSRGAEIVLIEIKRGDGLGLELVRLLASTPPAAPRVLVLTSYPTAWEEGAARRAGAEDYLLKDIDPEELITRILAQPA